MASERPSIEYHPDVAAPCTRECGTVWLHDVKLDVVGSHAAGAALAALASRGLDDAEARRRRLAAGGQVGYYVVFLLPGGQMEFCHTEGPLIEHFGHVAGLAANLAQRLRVPKVVILSWRELDAAPLVAPVMAGAPMVKR